MSPSKMTGAAVLLALASTAMAKGSATVINNCGFPIYYASIGQSQHAEMQEMKGSYTEQYGDDGNGISIKIAPWKDAHAEVTQFEFTWTPGSIFYDISNIDGFPFSKGGMIIEPSISNDPSNPTCVPVECAAGEAYCDAAYNLPDDVRTHVCSDQVDLVLTMCHGGSTGTYEDSSASTTTTTSAASTAATTGSSYPKRSEHGHQQRAHSRAFRA